MVCSIHQPRGSIVDLFDDICLMAGGRVIYMGPADAAAAWFAGLGHPVRCYLRVRLSAGFRV